MAAPPQIPFTGFESMSSSSTPPPRPALPRRQSSSLHKNVISKLRPLPFQYVWSVWHDKSGSAASSPTSTSTATPAASPMSSSPTAYDDRLTLLAPSVPDIATFYRIYNNFPWDAIKHKDSVHVFRQGVKPLWEDEENLEGGGWILKVRKEEGRSVKVWEEICLMGCGGELQASVQEERDHILGMSFSPRLYWVHVTIWTKQGENAKSIEMLEKTILNRLSPELRPQSNRDYYYKKHSDHEGWREAVQRAKAERKMRMESEAARNADEVENVRDANDFAE